MFGNKDPSSHHGLGLLLAHSPPQLRQLARIGNRPQPQLFSNLRLPPNHLHQDWQVRLRKGKMGLTVMLTTRPTSVGRQKGGLILRSKACAESRELWRGRAGTRLDYGQTRIHQRPTTVARQLLLGLCCFHRVLPGCCESILVSPNIFPRSPLLSLSLSKSAASKFYQVARPCKAYFR